MKGRISKRVFQENRARQMFRKTNISYSLIRFSENLACFVFLKHPCWDLPFCLITDDLQGEALITIVSYHFQLHERTAVLYFLLPYLILPEAVVCRCYSKYMFLRLWHISQQRKKQEKLQHKCFHIELAKFLRKFF